MAGLNTCIGQIFSYLRYSLNAGYMKGNSSGSPVIDEFFGSVLRDHAMYADYEIAENYWKKLCKTNFQIEIKDYGAGSKRHKTNYRTVASIAKHASVNRKTGRLLYRMSRYYKPGHIIEMGTSLGVSTHYLALGSPGIGMVTIEADPGLASIASENFKNGRLSHVQMINDTFDYALPLILPVRKHKTLVFVDGNHSYHATLKYADLLLSSLSKGSIIVFDDINWSGGMRQAWREIREKYRKCIAIDLFQIGIVFQQD